MTETPKLDRRLFLRACGATGLGLAAAGIFGGRAAFGAGALEVRIASNPGLENATLNALVSTKGYLRDFGVDAHIVEVPGASGPFKAVEAGEADVCMVSGYNRVMPAIENGADVRLVGAAMRRTALVLYSGSEDVSSVADLEGKTVGIGDELGLLHVLTLTLLRTKGIDPTSMQFENKGSNDNVYKAVAAGEVDAGLASISNLPFQERDGVRALDDGRVWQAVPEYTFQTAYASNTAIAEKRDALVGTLAAYGKLYRFLMEPESRDDFFAARRAAQANFDEHSAEAVWQFMQDERPYEANLAMSEAQIDYLQNLNVSLSLQKTVLAYEDVADSAIAEEAFARLG